MNETIPQIYAPSLYWFAYQYHEGLVISADATAKKSLPQSNARVNPEWVKGEYEKILKAFQISLDFSIRTDRPSRQFDLLENSDAETGRRYAYFTTEDEKSDRDNLEGFIYPQCLHDTYALNLNIFCPENLGNDEYAVADLGKFNPKNCFNPPSDHALGYLGKTLLLSAYLKQSPPENVHDLDDLAKQCWLSFFNLNQPDSLEKFPPLYRAARWFGGCLYEYGNPRADLTENPYGHLLIWFLFDERPTLLLQKCYWELPELLLYYHKVTKIFQDSRVFYARADKIVKKHETELNQLDGDYLNQETRTTLAESELQTLKITLKNLLKTSLTYSQQLRNLEYAQNTIAINTKNYQATLDYMAELAASPLEMFQVFGEKEAVAFQAQIRADLNYFKQGYSLLDTAISSIRGLVEIDQAEGDRNIDRNIAILGFGIGSAGVVASASASYAEEIQEIWPVHHYLKLWQLNHQQSHLAIGLNFSLLAGALASLITAGVIQLFKRRRPNMKK